MKKRAAIVDKATGLIENVIIVDDENIPDFLTNDPEKNLIIDDVVDFRSELSADLKSIEKSIEKIEAERI